MASDVERKRKQRHGKRLERVDAVFVTLPAKHRRAEVYYALAGLAGVPLEVATHRFLLAASLVGAITTDETEREPRKPFKTKPENA